MIANADRPWFRRISTPTTFLLLALAALPCAPALSAQDAAGDAQSWNAERVIHEPTFVTPPAEIMDAVLAPRHLNVSLDAVSADGAWFVHEVEDGPVTMDRFSRPFDELGGLFVDVAANRTRTLTNRSNAGIRFVSAVDGRAVDVRIPGDARVSGATWSPDGTAVAFYVHRDRDTHIWVASAGSAEARQVTRSPVLATLSTDFDWSADGSTLATVVIPEGRGARPVQAQVPTGPALKVTEEGENRLRTYASLMATPHDEALLEWHATGQVVLVDVQRRRETRVGAPAMVRSVDLSPDGSFVRVRRMVRPFSRIVPVSRFGTSDEIWSTQGEVLATLQVDSLDTGLRSDGPGGDEGAQGKREVAWRADGAGLTWLEREPRSAERDSDDDDGPRMDRVMLWAPPFNANDQQVVYASEDRILSHRFSPDHDWAFLSVRDGDEMHEFAVHLDRPDELHTLARYEREDFYALPGSLVLDHGRVSAPGRFFFQRFGATPGNGEVVRLSDDGSSVFYAGIEYARDPMSAGPRSFVDRVGITSGERERIYFSSNEGVYEELRTVLDADAGRYVVERESPTEVPQMMLRDGGALTRLTQNQDLTPDLTNAPREQFVVERPDGFRFRVTVNLPPGYRAGTRLPAMFWFYPREYEDQESYDESARTWNRNAFPAFGSRSMEFLVRLGYAVVEPDAPIIGPEGRMNDNYEHDLRNNLAAVIDELDRRELIDRRRLGIGGHSYGAFSTANAMVHTPFFKAGIAGDGNYNRTFTPLSFQSERRILWEAKDVYLGMSPFLHANNLTGALLLYHGEHDQNVGTAPDHTPRLFHALNGLGKTAAMYMYPFEDHGPATRETLLDLWGRWAAWLEVHLKDAEGGTRTVSP